MNAPALASVTVLSSSPLREWLGKINLAYQRRGTCSKLVHVKHLGPLRVQRPFYPEADGTCHTYLLHPPGGMAVGDTLSIAADLAENTQVLITTPSAGKMYGSIGVENAEAMPQVQSIHLNSAGDTQLEWLPQETIVFDGAQAELNTTIELKNNSQFIGWDIVRFGRAASGEQFQQGYCRQRLQCKREGKLVFRELNNVFAGSELMQAPWGLQAHNTIATMLATTELNRDQVDELYTMLPISDQSRWGLTQKGEFFIARYLGSSILDCRSGLNTIWHYVRPLVLNKEACVPRIWNT